MGNATIADLARRAVPFLRDEASKYEDDGSNEPLELMREIEAVLAEQGAPPRGVATGDTPPLYDVLMALDPCSRAIVVSAIKEGAPLSVSAMLAAAPAASGVDTSTNEAWAARAQEKIATMEAAASVSERARDERFTAMLIGIIADVQDELGFTAEDKECSNGSLEIVAAIRELKEQALTQQRGGGNWPGMSYWAVQLPGKMPKLYGVRSIAELNWYPDEGAELIRLQEIERIDASKAGGGVDHA